MYFRVWILRLNEFKVGLVKSFDGKFHTNVRIKLAAVEFRILEERRILCGIVRSKGKPEPSVGGLVRSSVLCSEQGKYIVCATVAVSESKVRTKQQAAQGYPVSLLAVTSRKLPR